ncbi:GFA family protein [Rhizobium sp. RCAM05973]
MGICHCTDCRQEGGSAFGYFAVWPSSAFQGRYHGICRPVPDEW